MLFAPAGHHASHHTRLSFESAQFLLALSEQSGLGTFSFRIPPDLAELLRSVFLLCGSLMVLCFLADSVDKKKSLGGLHLTSLLQCLKKIFEGDPCTPRNKIFEGAPCTPLNKIFEGAPLTHPCPPHRIGVRHLVSHNRLSIASCHFF